MQTELSSLEDLEEKVSEQLSTSRTELRRYETKLIEVEEVGSKEKEARLAELEQRLPEEKPLDKKTKTKLFAALIPKGAFLKKAKPKFEVDEAEVGSKKK